MMMMMMMMMMMIMMVNNDVLRGVQLFRNKAPTNSQFPIYDN